MNFEPYYANERTIHSPKRKHVKKNLQCANLYILMLMHLKPLQCTTVLKLVVPLICQKYHLKGYWKVIYWICIDDV